MNKRSDIFIKHLEASGVSFDDSVDLSTLIINTMKRLRSCLSDWKGIERTDELKRGEKEEEKE